MLAALAGLGMTFGIAVIILIVYWAVDIIETGIEHGLPGWKIALGIMFLILVVLSVVTVATFFGFMVISPLMPSLQHCG